VKLKTVIFLGGVFVFLCSYSVHALDEERGDILRAVSAKITEASSDYQQLEEEKKSISPSGCKRECLSSNACACFGVFCGALLLLTLYLTGNLHLRSS
jgi:hypothetical protein